MTSLQLKHDLKIRFNNSQIIWFCTIQKGDKPHLVPLWFVNLGNYYYIWTSKNSKKYKNLQLNRSFSLSIENGSKPIIGEGIMTNEFSPPQRLDLIEKFKIKYDWDNPYDSHYNVLLELEINKWMHFNG